MDGLSADDSGVMASCSVHSRPHANDGIVTAALLLLLQFPEHAVVVDGEVTPASQLQVNPVTATSGTGSRPDRIDWRGHVFRSQGDATGSG
jgi:hypothetical protein